MTTTLRLGLPWSAPPLRDNDRMHWAKAARIKRQARADVQLLALFARLPRGLPFVRIVLHWQPATNRTRDQLSPAPTLKPLVDGLVDYGLIVDDDIAHAVLGCKVYPYRRGIPAACWLEITPAPGPSEGAHS